MGYNRRRTITTLEVNYPRINAIEVSIEYLIGGSNWYGSSMTTDRGYYIMVTPVYIQEEKPKTYIAFTGYRKLIQKANRFSKKTLDTIKPDYTFVDKAIKVIDNLNRTDHEGTGAREVETEPYSTNLQGK